MRLVVVVSLIFLALPGTVFAQSAKSTLTDPAQAEMFNRVSDALVCQCGCNMILRVCNHFECPSAIPMRKEIERQIRAGMGEQEIIDNFVAEYGMVVLSAPPPEGINLAAWVMPGFAILIGGFVVFLVVNSMLAKRRMKPAPVDAGTPDSVTVARIEDELKKLDA